MGHFFCLRLLLTIQEDNHVMQYTGEGKSVVNRNIRSTVMSTRNPVCELSVGQCMESAMGQTRLRILIVGAGVAGATLGALLCARGERPVLMDRCGADDYGGYMLGLFPLGGRVLHSLNAYRKYQEISSNMARYIYHGRTGKVLNEFSVADFVGEYGECRGIDRGLLLALLRSEIPKKNIFYNTTIQSLQNKEQGALVTFSDGSAQLFDVVVGADGIHSEIRSLILSHKEYFYRQTGWGGWIAWRGLEGFDGETYREMWSDGWGMGIYPVKDRLGIFMGGNKELVSKYTADTFAKYIQNNMPKGALHSALYSLEKTDNSFFWNLEDCRTKHWFKHRVILLGDAAAAFLPTAGIGASMAMDSAAALADELSRADVDHLPYAFRLYVKRQRKRVEMAQDNSRLLAKVLFCNTPLKSKMRDAVMRFYTIKGLIRNIKRVMEGGR